METIDSIFILALISTFGVFLLSGKVERILKRLEMSGESRKNPPEDELDEEVIRKIQEGKINRAIALHFKRRNISLGEAQIAINRYISTHPTKSE